MDDIFTGAAAPLAQGGFDDALAALGAAGADAASLWAVLSVETRGFGFLPDRRPKILFERHIFHKRTQGQFSAAHPDISNRLSGGYVGGAGEYQRLKLAMTLDRRAALESASWGLGQVMGFNASSLGYAGAEDMVQRFTTGEAEQLLGCARFITANPALARAFQAGNWAKVAFYYNGASYAENAYDTKLSAFHARYADAANRPNLEARRGQAFLAYLGFDPKGIDGRPGGGTSAAVRAFEVSRGVSPPTGTLNTAMIATLEAAVREAFPTA